MPAARTEPTGGALEGSAGGGTGGLGGTGGWRGGWWWHARRRPCANHGPRPRGAVVDLAIVHSISLPPGIYGGPEIEQFFGNRLDCDAHPYFHALRGVEVSAHFVIRRSGEVLQFVDCDRRAWHAGRSRWRGRDNCNDHSIGIELEGLEGDAFEPPQYAALGRLLRALARRYPLREVVGHEHVAPGRKGDPGAGFVWRALRAALRRRRLWLIGDPPAKTRLTPRNRPPGRMDRGLREAARTTVGALPG